MPDCHSSFFFRGWVSLTVVKGIKKRTARNEKYDFKSDKSWEDKKKKQDRRNIYSDDLRSGREVNDTNH